MAEEELPRQVLLLLLPTGSPTRQHQPLKLQSVQ
jgi:hypothetical protein